LFETTFVQFYESRLICNR